jgi:hypothetical protein
MQKLFRFFIIGVIVASCSKSGSTYVNNPGAPDYLHNRPVGASARELLASDTYQSIRIEILYMPGFEPDAAALDMTQQYLGSLVNKPSGISISTRQIPSSGNAQLSVNEVAAIEKDNRTAFTFPGQIAICVLYTNGSFTDPATLGVAYRNTSIAVFGQQIRNNSGAIGQVSRTKLEATVLEHELGHLMGLVDLGTSMQTAHKDNQHGNHCNNSSCLMYYASETTDILGFLVTGAVPSLDANCRADLHANGGK